MTGEWLLCPQFAAHRRDSSAMCEVSAMSSKLATLKRVDEEQIPSMMWCGRCCMIKDGTGRCNQLMWLPRPSTLSDANVDGSQYLMTWLQRPACSD